MGSMEQFFRLRALAVTPVACIALLSCAPATTSAANLPCSTASDTRRIEVPESVTVSSDATTIAGGISIATLPTDRVVPISADTLVPDGDQPEAFRPDWKYAPGVPYAHPKGWGVQFSITSTTEIEFQVYARIGSAWSLSIDGNPSSDIPSTTPVATNAWNLVKFRLPNAERHTVQFFMNKMSLARIYGQSGASVEPVPRSGPRVFFLGDSITEGGGQSTGGDLGSWIWGFSRRCGFNDVWNGGLGSTGSIADSQGKSANYQKRVQTDVAPTHPDIVFLTSYYNDRESGTNDIATAFSNTINEIQTLPSKPLVVVTGSYDPTGGNDATYTQIDNALRGTCAMHGISYISPASGVVRGSSGETVDLAGDSGPWITEANKNSFIGADGIHLSDQGQTYYARRFYEAFRASQV